MEKYFNYHWSVSDPTGKYYIRMHVYLTRIYIEFQERQNGSLHEVGFEFTVRNGEATRNLKLLEWFTRGIFWKKFCAFNEYPNLLQLRPVGQVDSSKDRLYKTLLKSLQDFCAKHEQEIQIEGV